MRKVIENTNGLTNSVVFVISNGEVRIAVVSIDSYQKIVIIEVVS